MRHLITVCVLATGCSDPSTIDPTTRRALDATQAQCKQASADVETLRKQGLAAPDLHALLLRLDAQQAEIDALKMQTGRTRIPHLIIATTGEDLGPSLGSNCALSEKAGGEICFSPQRFYYTGNDCTGDVYVDEVRQSALLIGPNGDWFKANGPAAIIVTHSTLSYGSAQCSTYPPLGYPVTAMTDTGVPAQLLRTGDLAIELR